MQITKTFYSLTEELLLQVSANLIPKKSCDSAGYHRSDVAQYRDLRTLCFVDKIAIASRKRPCSSVWISIPSTAQHQGLVLVEAHLT